MPEKKTFLFRESPAAFCVRAALLLVVLGIVSITKPFDFLVTEPLRLLDAQLTHLFLGLLGTATHRSGPFVHSPTFSIEVIPECTGISALIILFALTLAFPAPRRFKATGLVAGAALIFFLNQIRLVTLFLVGQKAPELFEETHVFVWQAIFILVVALYWYAWARWALPGPGAAKTQPKVSL